MDWRSMKTAPTTGRYIVWHRDFGLCFGGWSTNPEMFFAEALQYDERKLYDLLPAGKGFWDHSTEQFTAWMPAPEKPN